jgi:hypothetical protein
MSLPLSLRVKALLAKPRSAFRIASADGCTGEIFIFLSGISVAKVEVLKAHTDVIDNDTTINYVKYFFFPFSALIG